MENPGSSAKQSQHQQQAYFTSGPGMSSTPQQQAGPSPEKIVEEFVTLQDRSKNLFYEIRDLPLYDQKNWQVHFEKAFNLFTRLWKFQQKHRSVLDSVYGLQRWQIGEIASRIAQMYYQYYLRTSDTAYLLESFAFYLAIRDRAYYSRTSAAPPPGPKPPSGPPGMDRPAPDLTVKKMRCYARFAVVCLLLKKMKLVRDLSRDLAKQIDDYITSFDPDDQAEWSLLLSELRTFVEADGVLQVVDVDNSTVILSHRLTPYCAPSLIDVDRALLNPVAGGSHLVLRQAVIIGSKSAQVKFSELTLDMLWFIQCLEWEPRDDHGLGPGAMNCSNNSPAPARNPYDRGMALQSRENPRKFLLYKPTLATLMVFLTNAFAFLPPDCVLLVYLSADGIFAQPSTAAGASTHSYDFGGIQTHVSKKEQQRAAAALTAAHEPNATQPGGPAQAGRFGPTRKPQCLYPGDLYPFLRKPFFLVVDSDNSTTFLDLPDVFGQPLVVLASPEELPHYLRRDRQDKGSLLTLFLHSPLTAFCLVCNIADLPIALWDKCQSHIDKFVLEAGRQLLRSKHVHPSYRLFYADEFLRVFLLRFLFAYYVCRMHRNSRDAPTLHPHCHPPILKTELVDHPSLRRIVLDLACILDVLSAFRDNDETVC